MTRLSEIEERERRATLGEWRTQKGDSVVYIVAERGAPIAATATKEYWRKADAQDEANAEFIAHSRADIPWLCAEVRRLRAALDDCETALRIWDESRSSEYWERHPLGTEGRDG